MFNHILVPLDGSKLSESAIPYVIYLAQKFNSKITLIHVVEHAAPSKVHGESHLQNFNEASLYFKKIISNLFPKNLTVEYHIHNEDKIDVVSAIVKHHKELSADLIIMTTHGWGGIKEIFYGNNAQQILRLDTIPVLFIPPDKNKKEKKVTINKIIVPIDTTKEHEAGLEAAESIAANLPGELHLISVIPTSTTLQSKNAPIGIILPSTINELLNISVDNAEKNIIKKINEISKKGIVAYGEVYRGNPVTIVSKIVKKTGINLLILGTHGKAGLDAFWSESFAAKITSKSLCAILFIPVRRKTNSN